MIKFADLKETMRGYGKVGKVALTVTVSQRSEEAAIKEASIMARQHYGADGKKIKFTKAIHDGTKHVYTVYGTAPTPMAADKFFDLEDNHANWFDVGVDP